MKGVLLKEQLLTIKSIQRGTANGGTQNSISPTTKSISINNINPDNAFVIINGGIAYASDSTSSDAAVYLSSLTSTTLNIIIQGASSNNYYLSWQVIEYY